MPTKPSETASVRRPTLKDVAAVAGVDASLVSKVVTGDIRLTITDATRRRVLAAIDQLGYRPNMRARGLRLSRTYLLGAIFPDLSNPVFIPIVQGAQARAASHGYGLVLGSASGPGASQGLFERMLTDHQVDGLLIASGQVSDARMLELASGSGPVVIVNRSVDGAPNCVVLDDEAGSRLAAKHLVELGHRRIGVVSGPVNGVGDHDSSVRRVNAFAAEARELGATIEEAYSTDWDAGSAMFAARSLLSSHSDLTAIYATTVLLALGVLRFLHDAGYRVPDDISVASLHDVDIAAYTYPPLTTVALPLFELGEVSVDRLLRRIDGGKAEDAALVVGPPTLVVRGSTARVSIPGAPRPTTNARSRARQTRVRPSS